MKTHKKDILGNFVKNPDVVYESIIKESTDEPDVYYAMITFLPGCRKLYVNNGEKEYCLAGEGYRWVMYLPLKENWCLNGFYSPKGELIEWYFDISRKNFFDENKMPCIDDLFLDFVIMPDGKTFTIDADELREALDKNEITSDDFKHAYKVRDEIIVSKWNDVVYLENFFNKLLLDFN